MNENSEPEVAERTNVEPLPVESDGEVLDGDAYAPPPPAKREGTIRPSPVSEDDVEKDEVPVSTPPPRRSGTILVQLKYGGRRKPIPVDFPDDYDETLNEGTA